MIAPFSLRFVPDPDQEGAWDVQIDAPEGLSAEDAVRRAFQVLAFALIEGPHQGQGVVEGEVVHKGEVEGEVVHKGEVEGEVVHKGEVVIRGYHLGADTTLQEVLATPRPFGSTPIPTPPKVTP